MIDGWIKSALLEMVSSISGYVDENIAHEQSDKYIKAYILNSDVQRSALYDDKAYRLTGILQISIFTRGTTDENIVANIQLLFKEGLRITGSSGIIYIRKTIRRAVVYDAGYLIQPIDIYFIAEEV